ncbi:DUF47 family protein [Escherichia coli]|uniref:Uncharacterized protein n=1 Tax=Escherichia coli TaxID=562 RepID=A0A2P9ELH3_ECOLX|nr:DUF47 family protein [Escherichia coli]EGD4828717.1 DUF47 family protein [Escherichia coli]EGD5022089.1 DUF47 family protein [Escherichia coli]EGD5153102.1 DUF47 family protein [Escherichia coli]SPE04175.1 conserved protein of unknown function [Escherichia coli]HBK2818648.1 DUF47 family protein [Escherichia coli]
MDKIQDTKAAWQALQEDEVMRKIAIERLVEGFHELEELIKNYPVKIQEQNYIYFENLRNDINNITEAINSLPDAIDEKTSQLQLAAVALHDEFQESKGEVKGSLEEARINATEKLTESAKELQDNITKVAEKTTETIETVNKIITNIESDLYDINKKALHDYVKKIKSIEEKRKNISTNLESSINSAFKKSVKSFKFYCSTALFISTVLQFTMWGFFLYKLLT